MSVYFCFCRCVFHHFIFSAPLAFCISDLLLCTLIVTTMMSFENLKKQILFFSLSKISKHKSLFKNDTNTLHKKDKKKVNVHIKG